MATRTVAELTEGALHVGYEFESTVGSALALLAAKTPIELNAFLECTLLHAPNLIDFLTVTGPKYPDDVWHGDFTTRWDPGAYTSLRVPLSDINKHLAHLTWERVKGAPPWPFVALARDVREAFARFVEVLRGDPDVDPAVRAPFDAKLTWALVGSMVFEKVTVVEGTTSMDGQEVEIRHDLLADALDVTKH
jgi:hypothetical protein